MLALNYFGHSVIASWRDAPPATVLGAMLPDFANMCRGRLAREQPDAAVAEGVALHHRTDGVFHDLAPVQAQMRELDARLGALDVARGPRLAVAHVGIELMLDGVLVVEPTWRATYEAAIADDTEVAWRELEDTARFAELRARLRTSGVPDDLASVESIVYRLQRVLGPRPRLAPSATDLVGIRTALVAQQPRVAIAAETIMRALRAALG